MEEMCKEEDSESLPIGVYELAGEPAVVINGVPPRPPINETLVPCGVSDFESHRTTRYGEWLMGREVRKLFGEQFYSGRVTEFDKDTGWYRVVYEDGDFEDLEWHELEDLLQPLDITMPLKVLALRIIRKRQKTTHRSRKTATKSRSYRPQNVGDMAQTMEVLEEVPKMKLNDPYRKGNEDVPQLADGILDLQNGVGN